MLTITVPGQEFYDESTGEFFTKGDVVLHLEHSLVSLSKWESIWEVPFLAKGERTPEQLYSYVKCMCTHALSDEEVFGRLTEENLTQINNYLDAKNSATVFSESRGAPSREVITSEIIYYWMVQSNIPFETQHWNLNRLFNLIRIYGIKNSKQKRMSRSDALSQQHALNEQRRQALGTSG
jgi:hypothetical protein